LKLRVAVPCDRIFESRFLGWLRRFFWIMLNRRVWRVWIVRNFDSKWRWSSDFNAKFFRFKFTWSFNPKVLIWRNQIVTFPVQN
jgi:hypothetical protein